MERTAYSTFIFDFDLTLADSSTGILISFKETLAHYGYPLPDDRTIYNTIGMTVHDALCLLSGVPAHPLVDEMRAYYSRVSDGQMSANTFFYPDTARVLNGLKAAGAKTAIVSTKHRRRITESFAMKLPDASVDLIVGGEDVASAKPDPEGLNKAIALLCADRTSVLYVGDSYIDAQTAQNACVAFAAVTTGSTPTERFSAYPCVTVSPTLSGILTRLRIAI
ncbi:MAG: HAD-IA family hydrolase [Oscillospiraceae bacterium]